MDAAADVGQIAQRARAQSTLFLGALAIALTATVLLSVGHGAVTIAPTDIAAILAGQLADDFAEIVDPVQQTVLLSIRLPRVVLGLLTGAALAVSGAALQGLFRNPLADPGLIGVSTGAALAAVAVIVLGGAVVVHLPQVLVGYLLPLSAFAGGLLATLLVYRIASRDGRTEVATMLLAGIALNAIAAAGIGLFVFISDDQQLRDLEFWLLGSLGGTTWQTLLTATPFILFPVAALMLFARQLNALLLGEVEALHLGFNVEAAKLWIVVLVALTVGASVALTGVIGFVGLVVPHLVRLMIGPDHRNLLPACVLLGPILLLLADLAARSIVLPAELPIGILTSCIGGPFFIWLLMRRRGLGMW